MNKKTNKLKKCFACQTNKFEYLENCDECKKEFCIECLGLYHGSERLFCQDCFNKKSDEEKLIMCGLEGDKEYRDKQLEIERKKYREWVEKHPYPIGQGHGLELKECESCYCDSPATGKHRDYDFCFDCLGSDGCGHSNYDPNFGNCCACFDPKSGIKTRKKRKKLTFDQRQRLYWEEIKLNAEDKIEEIKDNADYAYCFAKSAEDAERWTRQEKERVLKNLTIEELLKELEQRKETKKNLKNTKTKIGVVK